MEGEGKNEVGWQPPKSKVDHLHKLCDQMKWPKPKFECNRIEGPPSYFQCVLTLLSPTSGIIVLPIIFPFLLVNYWRSS